MFDCKQDVKLLHGSLLSATYSNSDNLLDYAKIKDAVHTVYNSIKMIIHHSLKTAKDEKEKINIQLHYNERLHAAIFFTTLRSHDIKSQAAGEFYDSIQYNWPSMNLKFYVELNFKCDWSEYFVMCALQLPSATLLNVLKMISEIPFESDVECYAWHLIMQTLIYKLYQVPSDKDVHYPFNFDFVVESAVSLKKIKLQKKTVDDVAEKNCETIKVSGIIIDENHKLIINGDKTNYKSDDDKCNNVSDSGNETLVKETHNFDQISNRTTDLDDEDTEDDDEYLTPFSYEISDNDDEITKTQNEDLSCYKELCYSMHRNILKLRDSNEIGVFKVLLFAVKTILKFVKNEQKLNSNILSFENYIKLLKSYFSSDVCKENIKNELKDCSVIFTRHAYATVSWNVCLHYLIFLVEQYIEETYPNALSCEQFNGCDFICKDVIHDMHSLYNLNYPFLKSNEHIDILCKIMEFKFEGSSFAANVLISNIDILKQRNVLTTLEENYHVINHFKLYCLIVEHVMSTDSPVLKQNLLKIFYTCLQKMNKLDLYNTVAGYIIANHGFTKEFQLPNYNDLLSKFEYETPNQEEIKKNIPAMLIQNPKTTLKFLIYQSLVQGPKGEIIQILKYFPNVCIYMTKSGPVCILHEMLNDYFEKPDLKPSFVKHMNTLYRFLSQVHSEAPILLPCDFFNEYIIPKLHPDYVKLELVLECITVLIPALLSDDYFLNDPEVFYILITKFGILANSFIVKGNGEMKSKILIILKGLEIHQQRKKQINEKQKLQLWSTFRNFDEMTCVYFEQFLPENIEFVSRAAVWIRCCKNEGLSDFEEKFSVTNITFPLLVNTLVEVLPHLTKEECFYCFNFVKVCCASNKVQDEITCSNNFFQLCGSDLCTYAAILTILKSARFVLDNNIDGSSYLSSCVSNFLTDIIFKEGNTHPHFMLSVALEICHLISCVSPNIISIFHATLLAIKKELYSYSMKSGEKDFSELLECAMQQLDPTSLPNVYQDEHNII